MREDSIWKKEITLGRKKRPAGERAQAETAAPEEPKSAPTSFWKKEFSVGRKKPAAPPQLAVEAVDVPTAEQVPFWQKEISLGGKKEPKSTPRPKDEPAVPAAEQVPFWKREVGLPHAKTDPAAGEQTSVWKKEITLGRKRQKEVERLSEEAARAFVPEAVQPPAPIEPEMLHEPVASPLAVESNAEIEVLFARHPAAPLPDPEPQPFPAAAAVPPPPPAPPAQAERLPSFSLPEPENVATPPGLEPLPEPPPLPAEVESVLRVPVPPAPAAPVPPQPAAAFPVAPEPAPPVPSPAPIAAQYTPPSRPPVHAAAEETGTLPVAGPAVVHPPVPAAELRAEVEAAPAVPFWKREITLSRKPKPETATVRTPKQVPESTSGPERPFLRKQIAIGKRSSRKAASGEASIWKKEINLTRKAKRPAVAGDKVPFWKKEIGGSKKKAPAAAAAAGAPAPLKQKPGAPFWKRELSLKSLGTPKKSSAPHSVAGVKQEHEKVKRLVGLKVGASQIAAARVANNGAAELMQVARQPLEQGIVVGGELREPEALAEQLKIFFNRNKLPKRNVRLGIASNRIGVRIFEVAGIEDDAQLENAIHFRAQEALPIPLDEAVLDYHVLDEFVNDEGQTVRRILLVVAYRELVDRYVSACKKAGISLMGVDLEAFALLRALAAPRADDGPATAAIVAVAIGHDRSTFAVSDGRVCEFTRVLEWGGASLNIAIARALDLAPSEVESIKRSISLENTSAVPDGLTEQQWPAVVDAVRRQLQSFARELVSSLQFYQNQPGSLGIGEIVLTGGTAHMPGLAAEMQRLMSVQVRLGDPLARLKVGKKVADGEQIGSLAVAIGLGIED